MVVSQGGDGREVEGAEEGEGDHVSKLWPLALMLS